MAAYTELPDGRLIRWHANLTECDQPTCDRYHVSKAELLRFDPNEDRAKHYERGVAAGKGER